MSKIVKVYSKGVYYNMLVDDDFDESIKVYLDKDGYAIGKINNKTVRLHRLIINAPKGVVVDHKNRNKLDNRKENLRLADDRQNRNNQQRKGVSYYKRYNKWLARIQTKEKRIHLGYFDTEKEAQQVYRKAHAEAFGEFSPYYNYYQGNTKELNQ